jgi:transposase-like protein
MSPPLTNRYTHHHFPAEMISHGVWLYFQFCLSYRDVEELLFARGIVVTYEAIRQSCRNLANPMPISSDADALSQATRGI